MVLKGRLRDRGRCTAADYSAAGMVEGAWWTSARLHAAGLKATAVCAACKKAVGTYWHRMGECEATRAHREGDGGCPAWLLRKGKAHVWDPLFSRGIPALPRIPRPPPERAVWTVVNGARGEAQVATGDVYTDGAVRGKWRRIMRGGWGVVVLEEGAQRVVWRMHGTCGDLYPSVLRAELMAVVNVLRIVLPPVVIHVDNAEVVKGFKEGPSWCLAAGRDGGDIWREVWRRMEDVGGGVGVRKVKAHTDEEDVELGIVSARDRFGNFLADAEAKRGAKLAESLSPVGVARAELVKGLRWMGWARRYAAGWRADVEEEEEEARAGREATWEGEGRPGRVAAGLRHLIWERGLEWKCRRCGREANTEQRRRAMRSSRCLGSAVGRLLAKTCGDPEAVVRSCVERKGDMEGRGWRPKGGAEGGECSSTGVQYLFGEEEDELGNLTGQEEREGGSGGSGWCRTHRMWNGAELAERISGGDGGAEAAPAAAALAGGSGSASASAVVTAAKRPRLPAASPAGAPLTWHPGLPASPQGTPELPGEVAEAVIAELGVDLHEGQAVAAGSAVAEARRERPRTETASSDRGAAAAIRGVKRGPGRDDDDVPRQQVRQRLHGDQRGRSARLAGDGGDERGTKRAAQHSGLAHADEGARRAVPVGRQTAGDDNEAGGSMEQWTRATSVTSATPTGAPGEHADGGPGQARGPSGGEKRRRLSMTEGYQSTARVQGRRYTGVVSDPVDADGAQGHSLFITGPIIWCDRCGRYATRRVRQSLKNACAGSATGAYPTRLARLRSGRHPMTGELIVT